MLDSDAFSAEDQGIDGPCAWTEHGQAYAQNGEQEMTLVAAWICDHHQQLGDPLKAGNNRGPEPEANAIPTRIKPTLISHSGDGGMGNIIWILSTIREQPAARRNNRRPNPGLPVGKVEYKRCTENPLNYRT